ncbi:speedy protein A [Diretmus argenteus]
MMKVIRQANAGRSLQNKRGLQLKRPNAQEPQGPPAKSQPSRRQGDNTKLMSCPILVVQREEMAAFFRLFDDDLIQDFLWMDCCCKITDKYLLAMTFVYFKRAQFTLTEHNRKNFFIALYLANTMEEDEEESKYEIFPWALGKSWKMKFPHFLKQRDKLWVRIQHRAAVSRHCCEEVMAIMSSHFIWKRERAEHHSGARRHYDDWNRAPRGPLASPAHCSLCDHAARSGQGLRSSPPSSGSSAQTPSPPLPPFNLALALSMETTPPRATVSHRAACHCHKVPRR